MDQMLTLMTEMLNNACGSLSETPLRKDGPNELEEFNRGYQEYRIETHCVAFIINAKRDDIKPLEDAGAWDIRDWKMEDC